MPAKENILLAEIGSTSGSWAYISENGTAVQILNTPGYNPHTHSEYILERLLINIKGDIGTPGQIFYYGAGVVEAEVSEMIKGKITTQFEDAHIEVYSDTLAAARASCGSNSGHVCILGTGSNSCIYDGIQITDSIPSLGYPLGDEGSGWQIGLAVIRGYYYRTMPPDLVSAVGELLPDSRADLLEYVKHSPTPNTYLGSFANFAGEQKSHPWIRITIRKCFDEFVVTHVLPLHPEGKIHFVGSIAWSFSEILEESLADHNIQIGHVLKDPLDALIKFHLSI
jgi:hypothetical protein